MKIEYIFVTNFLVNLAILLTCSQIMKDKGRLFLLSAFLGSCFTVALHIYSLSKLGQVLVSFGMTIWFVCISFKFRTFKKFVLIFLCYVAVSMLFAGLCNFLASLIEIQSVIVVLISILLALIICKFVVRKVYRKNSIENFCHDVEIENAGQKLCVKAFLDSGNLLVDPVTQSPVNFVNFKMFSALFPDISIEDIFRHSQKIKKLKFAHYINFSTLAGTDKILVFQVEKINIEGRCFQKVTFGLLLQNFDTSFGTDMILNNNFAKIGGEYEFV